MLHSNTPADPSKVGSNSAAGAATPRPDTEHARATLPDRLAFPEAEAAALLGLHAYQLRDERRRGRVRASRGPGGKILYTRQNLLDYLLSRPWEPTDSGRTDP
jgi:hypothetical protein